MNEYLDSMRASFVTADNKRRILQTGVGTTID